MGIELEPFSSEDTLYLFEFEYFLYKELGDIGQTNFREKPGFFTEEEISRAVSTGHFEGGFIDMLLNMNSLIKRHGRAKYKDAKGQGSISLPGEKINGAETRVVKPGNKNQSGFARSSIVDGEKTIHAMITGLRGWVSESYVRRIARKVSEKDGVEKSIEDISIQYMDGLIKLNIPGLHRNIYSTLEKMVDIAENASEYPSFVTQAIQNHKNFMDPNVSRNQIKDKVVSIYS